MKKIVSVFLSIIICWLVNSIYANESPLNQNGKKPIFAVSNYLKKNKIYVGDIVDFEIVITHQKDLKINFLPNAITSDGIEVLNFYKTNIIVGEIVKNKIIYQLTSYQVGKFEIPSSEVIAQQLSDKKKKFKLKTKTLYLLVISTLSGESANSQIEDINPPLASEGDNYRGIIIIVSLLVISLGLFLLVWFFVIRKKLNEQKPAWDKALERLRKLEKKSSLSHYNSRFFFEEISDLLKHFLTDYYKLPFIYSTTKEIQELFKQNNTKHKETYIDILRDADRVKFAKGTVDRDVAIEYLRKFDSHLFVIKAKMEEKKTQGKKNARV